jgi:hypothetical protein
MHNPNAPEVRISRPDRPADRRPPRIDGRSLGEGRLEAMEAAVEARIRAELGLHMDGRPVEDEAFESHCRADSQLSAASQLVQQQRRPGVGRRGHSGNVVTISTGAKEPVHGLLKHSWITCDRLFRELTDELIEELLTKPEGCTMLLRPDELDLLEPLYRPFLSRCSELRGQDDRLLSIAEWHQELRACCADVEARHCEIIELGGNMVRVVIVHLDSGLFGHVLLLTAQNVEWLRPGVTNMPTDTTELYTFYASFLSTSIEKASGLLP